MEMKILPELPPDYFSNNPDDNPHEARLLKVIADLLKQQSEEGTEIPPLGEIMGELHKLDPEFSPIEVRLERLPKRIKHIVAGLKMTLERRN